jgi:hypothetical protein
MLPVPACRWQSQLETSVPLLPTTQQPAPSSKAVSQALTVKRRSAASASNGSATRPSVASTRSSRSAAHTRYGGATGGGCVASELGVTMLGASCFCLQDMHGLRGSWAPLMGSTAGALLVLGALPLQT